MSKRKKQEYKIIHDDEIDLKALWMVLWTNKLALVKITVGFFLLVVIYIIFATPLYYSNSTIVQTDAEASSSMSSIVSLASSVGMDMGQSTEAPKVSIVDFVLSRRLRNDILDRTWLNKNHQEFKLIPYWGIDDTTGIIYILKAGLKTILGSEEKTTEETRLKWLDEGRSKLEDRVIARFTETGMIVIEVWMEDPLVTQSITNYIVDAVVAFTNQLKADRWKTNREFLVQRMEDVKIELKATEDSMTKFQKDNRRVTDSPELMIELANLKRDVEIKTQLYMTLQNEYEFARIEEAKDVAEVVILDDAYYPVEVDKPKKILLLILSIFIGGVLSIPGYLIYRSIRH